MNRFLQDKNQNKITFIVGICIVVVVAAVFMIRLLPTSNKSNDELSEASQSAPINLNYKEALIDIASPETKEMSDDEFLAGFEQHYDESVKQVRESDPTKWDISMVDRAFTCLLYANRTKMYDVVEDIATKIEGARASKINVDDNSAGITKEDVASIKDEASRQLDEQIKTRSEENEEV